MKLSDFDYSLPRELIAQFPLKERDSARLLVLNRRKQTIEHRVFRDIDEYLNKDDLLVLNDTRVLACRLFGRRASGGKVEVLLLRKKEEATFKALIRPGRLKVNEKIHFGNNKLQGIVSAKDEVTFANVLPEHIYRYGVMPLPPYIKREAQGSDSSDYQTVYAREDGAVACPTAGLHFTENLLKRIEASGVGIARVTLHVGYGTFKPVKAEDISGHIMEEEYFSVSDEALRSIEVARANKGRIIAVGTTSCRTLESLSRTRQSGYTDLFIYPGYAFKMTDAIVTNFHLPRTTLYMLVCAFAGAELIKKSYAEAVSKKYRFYSYGDAMMIV